MTPRAITAKAPTAMPAMAPVLSLEFGTVERDSSATMGGRVGVVVDDAVDVGEEVEVAVDKVVEEEVLSKGTAPGLVMLKYELSAANAGAPGPPDSMNSWRKKTFGVETSTPVSTYH